MQSQPDSSHHSIELNHASFVWDLDAGKLAFFGLPSSLFWLNPSLLRLLQPLTEEIGIPLFRLLVAHSSSIGTEEDYHAMVTALGSTFEEGFLAWGRAVASAGWGSFELPHFDAAAKRATVVVRNPWELVMQHGQANSWGCPFLQGKIIGIFSHALGVSCWADERLIERDNEHILELQVYASNLTIISEVARLRKDIQQQQQQQLEASIAAKTRELEAMQAERDAMREQALQAQSALIAELSTPLIPLSERVVVMPLIGQIDSIRAQRVIETLLHGISEHQPETAILDITGLSIMDTSVANVLLRAAQAVRLLGTDVVITGIRPEVAQTLVGLGVELHGIVTRATLQSGISYAMRRRESIAGA